MLTDRYLNGIPSDSRVRTDGRFLKEDQVDEKHMGNIRRLDSIAKGRGQSLAEMALAWLLNDEDITSVIIGASKPAQITQNVKAIGNTEFTPGELREIDSYLN